MFSKAFLVSQIRSEQNSSQKVNIEHKKKQNFIIFKTLFENKNIAPEGKKANKKQLISFLKL
jgi:hypothetical protein